MDTNNLDKWWYGLPENTRQAIGNDGIWEKLDMPSRSALHRYSRLRIYGTAKDRDEERTLLNEIACGLGDLALVRKNGIALEKMCNGNGEFYDEYQEQFDILYDNYGHTIENISWPDWIGHTIPTNTPRRGRNLTPRSNTAPSAGGWSSSSRRTRYSTRNPSGAYRSHLPR